jgi:hypothetical protein
MPFRSKCTHCGRKQSVPDEDAGRSVWCNACGGRFNAIVYTGSDNELESDCDAGESLIPELHFPLQPIPQPVSAPVPTSPPAIASKPIGVADQEGTRADSVQRPYVATPSIVPATPSSSLIPIGIAALLAVALLMAVGVFFLGEWFGQRQQVVAASSPQAKTIYDPKLYSVSIPAPKPKADGVDPVVVEPATPPQSIPHTQTQAGMEPATQPALARSQTPAQSPVQSLVPSAVPQIVQHVELTPPQKFHPVRPAIMTQDMDDQIGRSIDRGVDYLLSQFNNGELKQTNDNNGMTEGMDALAVYALLQAGEATHDPRLGPNSPLVAQMLDAVKKFPMNREDSTYSRSLRCAALSVYHRADDKQALRTDCTWLIADASNGAYTYQPQPREPEARADRLDARRRETFSGTWDNSNSQYGALGVWAALEAGVEVPNSFWMAVQKHWLSCQLPDGEWAYTGYGDMGRLSMTVAGITTLLVTEDQLDARLVVNQLGHPPFTPALQHGLNWLESGNNSVRLPANWRTYNLFGLERAALASGFKYFGTHDWYRELAKEQLALQEPNGSWVGSHPIVDTAYTLLFLSRGRHPIFMNKLRFDTYWANRPRDIANLSHYASTVLERPINWQVVSFKSGWSDWMDSPVLYIASHEALNFSDDDCNKLRSFAENGGLIFTHADGDMPAFNRSVAELSKKLFPNYPLTELPGTHPIYSTLYKIKQQPKLAGVSNGSRLLLLHSPTDLNKAWQQDDFVQKPVNFQMGINIFIYAAGKANLRNKLKTPLVPEAEVTPILTTQLARLKYPGDWDPEPDAWLRFSRLFLGETSVKLGVTDIDPLALDARKMPVAQLSGVIAIRYDTAQLRAIQTYVDNGGILIIDACGGSQTFLKSILIDLLPHAFPKSLANDIGFRDPLLLGKGAGMTPVSLKLRPYREETDGAQTLPVQVVTEGKGMVILSDVDITTGLLGTNTWSVNGYTPETCYDLVRNIVLFALER